MKRFLIPLLLLPMTVWAGIDQNTVEQFLRDVHTKEQLSHASVYACKAGIDARCVDAQQELQELSVLTRQRETLNQMKRIDPDAFRTFLANYYSIDAVVQNSDKFEEFRKDFNEKKQIQLEEQRQKELAKAKSIRDKKDEEQAKKAAEIQSSIDRNRKYEEYQVLKAKLMKYGHIVFVLVCLIGYKIWGLKAFYGPYAYVTDHVKDIFDIGVTYSKASTSGYKRYRTSSLDRAKNNLMEGIGWVIFAYLLVTLFYVGIYYASIYSPVFVYNVFIN